MKLKKNIQEYSENYPTIKNETGAELKARLEKEDRLESLTAHASTMFFEIREAATELAMDLSDTGMEAGRGHYNRKKDINKGLEQLYDMGREIHTRIQKLRIKHNEWRKLKGFNSLF